MRKANIGLAVFFLAFGALCLYDSISIGWRWLPVTGPGPGFMPFYLALGCVICSALVIFRGLRKPDTGEPLIPEGALGPILWVLIPSTAMLVIVPIFGLHVSAFIYIAFYMRVVGKIEWVKCALVSIAFPVSLFVIFDRLFLIPLPGGKFELMENSVGLLVDVVEKLF